MARRDYFYDPEAPKPNSLRPATAVALFNSGGAGSRCRTDRVVMVQKIADDNLPPGFEALAELIETSVSKSKFSELINS
jgi:hypothetical protein